MDIKVGDTVKMAAKWLKSTGIITGELPFAEGVVTAIAPMGKQAVADVNWNIDEAPARVLTVNLVRKGALELID